LLAFSESKVINVQTSSGGESALIACHGSPLGVGTDIGGNIVGSAGVTTLCQKVADQIAESSRRALRHLWTEGFRSTSPAGRIASNTCRNGCYRGMCWTSGEERSRS
jgi:hypothetical protein